MEKVTFNSTLLLILVPIFATSLLAKEIKATETVDVQCTFLIKSNPFECKIVTRSFRSDPFFIEKNNLYTVIFIVSIVQFFYERLFMK